MLAEFHVYILTAGIILFIASSLFSTAYSVAARYAAMFMIAFGCLQYGIHQERVKWELAEMEYRVQVTELQSRLHVALNRAPQISTEVVTQYVDRVRTIERVRTVEVERFIPVEVVGQCTINNGFVRLHDAAALMRAVMPETTDINPSEIDLIRLAEVINENYKIHYQTREQLIALQDWVRLQEQLWQDMQRSLQQ